MIPGGIHVVLMDEGGGRKRKEDEPAMEVADKHWSI
jgi:hypothetical protein